MKATQITLTPALASQILANNFNNRRLSEARAVVLANAIKRGEWQFNGESIIISETGMLLDGQHRCRAVVLSGIPIAVLLVEGVIDTAFTTIDVGEKRGPGQIFTIQGFANGQDVSATISVLEMYLQNRTARAQLTYAQRAKILEQYPDITKSVTATLRMRLIPESVAAVAHFVAVNAYGREFADTWFKAFREAIFDDSRRALSLHLEKARTARRKFSDAHWILVLTLKALLASAKGTSLKKINSACSSVYPSL